MARRRQSRKKEADRPSPQTVDLRDGLTGLMREEYANRQGIRRSIINRERKRIEEQKQLHEAQCLKALKKKKKKIKKMKKRGSKEDEPQFVRAVDIRYKRKKSGTSRSFSRAGALDYRKPVYNILDRVLTQTDVDFILDEQRVNISREERHF
uniref:Uncharacterized protein n=1 Tax=Steinernema glaseri TaxID=37863 RepID=A0A1I7ZY62_9BILA